MLRKSKDGYTDRTPRRRWAKAAEKLIGDLAVYLPAEARPCTPGDDGSEYGPGGDDQKCGEKGTSGAGGSLTEHDLLLVHDQARLQHAESPEQLHGLTDAWNAAKSLVHENPEVLGDPEQTEALALRLAAIIEPRNKGGYRQIPVTFGPGKPPALSPKLVPRAMEQLFNAYSEQFFEPDEWYEEFEKVHPFEDGNGRVGDLLWKMDHVRRGQPWPNTHPPDVFGTDESELSAALAEVKSHVSDIERETVENTDFRRVLYTGKNMQLVLMSLRVGEEIGEEVHDDPTQFLRFEAGKAKVTTDDQEHKLEAEMSIIIPEGVKHNVINTGDEDLKFYSIYTPPQHAPDTVHKTKQDADDAEDTHAEITPGG